MLCRALPLQHHSVLPCSYIAVPADLFVSQTYTRSGINRTRLFALRAFKHHCRIVGTQYSVSVVSLKLMHAI